MYCTISPCSKKKKAQKHDATATMLDSYYCTVFLWLNALKFIYPHYTPVQKLPPENFFFAHVVSCTLEYVDFGAVASFWAAAIQYMAM